MPWSLETWLVNFIKGLTAPHEAEVSTKPFRPAMFENLVSWLNVRLCTSFLSLVLSANSRTRSHWSRLWVQTPEFKDFSEAKWHLLWLLLWHWINSGKLWSRSEAQWGNPQRKSTVWNNATHNVTPHKSPHFELNYILIQANFCDFGDYVWTHCRDQCALSE